MHRLLVLSRRASDYHGFVEAARLPDLVITSTPDAADAAANGATYDLAFGEPALLRQVLPALTLEIQAHIDEEEYLATKIRLLDSLQRCLSSGGTGKVQM